MPSMAPVELGPDLPHVGRGIAVDVLTGTTKRKDPHDQLYPQ